MGKRAEGEQNLNNLKMGKRDEQSKGGQKLDNLKIGQREKREELEETEAG